MANKQELLSGYIVLGSDQLMRERVLKRLRIRLEELGDLSFNNDKFNGNEADVDEILAACQTLPFASEKRLVVVDEANKIPKKDSTKIAEYIKSPSATTVLVLICESLTKDSPLHEFQKQLGANSIIECSPPKKKSDFINFVINMAKDHGLELTSGAAAKIVELVGMNTVHINEEFKKLALANHGQASNKPITEEEIINSVAQLSVYQTWDFVDAFSRRNISECIRIKPHLVIGNSSASISSALLRQCVTRIRELICARCVSDVGSDSTSRIAQELNLPPNRAFTAKYRLQESRNFTLEELCAALMSSVTAEQKMKSGTDDDAAFEEWLYSVIGKS